MTPWQKGYVNSALSRAMFVVFASHPCSGYASVACLEDNMDQRWFGEQKTCKM